MLKIEIAPRGNTNMTDWNNSVSMNLSTEAVGQLLVKMNSSRECSIQFDQTSMVCKPRGKGSFKIMVQHEDRSAEMVLNGGEIEVVKSLMQCAIPQLVAWDTMVFKSFDRSLQLAQADY